MWRLREGDKKKKSMASQILILLLNTKREAHGERKEQPITKAHLRVKLQLRVKLESSEEATLLSSLLLIQ